MAAPNLTPQDEHHIEVRGVSKSFGKKHVLRDIDLSFGRGQITVIIGGSGTGKTTLLRMLIGLEKPTTGAILIGRIFLAVATWPLERAAKKQSP